MSPRQQRGVERLLPRRSKPLVTLIPHGVDLTRFAATPGLEGASNGRLRLLYAGRLDCATKGVHWLPGILSRLRLKGVDVQLDIAGDGPDRESLFRSLDRQGVRAWVNWMGALPEREMEECLLQQDVLVLPSRVEGFPNILVEAMAAGVVPVASRIPGVTDFIVDHGRDGDLCSIGRPEEFAEAIAALWRDRGRLGRMAQEARRTVEDRFTMGRMGRDYDALFREVLAEPIPDVQPRPLSEFRIERAYRSGMGRFLPRRLKNAIRSVVRR